MNLLVRQPASLVPGAEGSPAADHAGIVDLDPWEFSFFPPEWAGPVFAGGEVDMDVQALCLKGSETVGNL